MNKVNRNKYNKTLKHIKTELIRDINKLIDVLSGFHKGQDNLPDFNCIFSDHNLLDTKFIRVIGVDNGKLVLEDKKLIFSTKYTRRLKDCSIEQLVKLYHDLCVIQNNKLKEEDWNLVKGRKESNEKTIRRTHRR